MFRYGLYYCCNTSLPWLPVGPISDQDGFIQSSPLRAGTRLEKMCVQKYVVDMLS